MLPRYTWNWFVGAHPLEARGDLGPLWYLSVEMQFYLVLAVVVALWGARRRELGLALLILIPLVTWWRWHSYDVEGWYISPLRTSTRIDGLLWGALVALLVPYLQSATKLLPRLRRDAAAFLGASSLVMIGVVMSSSRFDIGDYMKLQGLVMAVAVAMFRRREPVCGAHDPDSPSTFVGTAARARFGVVDALRSGTHRFCGPFPATQLTGAT